MGERHLRLLEPPEPEPMRLPDGKTVDEEAFDTMTLLASAMVMIAMYAGAGLLLYVLLT
jgi:hypothetical protein